MSDAVAERIRELPIDAGRFDVAQIAATLPETSTTLLVEHMEALYFDFVIFKLTFSRIFADLTLSSNGEAILNLKNIMKSRRAP